MKSTSQRTAYIVSHTHWDREWRQPIWGSRILLCKFMDELVEMIESGRYPGFLLDGQLAPILDYLEVRPEMSERIKGLVSSGKLQTGPWLTLPDFYPIDGESVVRNLLLGRRIAQSLGSVFNVAYTPCGWGQASQLPQIYRGFDIDFAMVGKKAGSHRAAHSEFIWESPDGSEILTTRFGDCGRANFYFKVHLTAMYGVVHESKDWKYEWGGKSGVAYHRADWVKMEQEHLLLNPPKQWHPNMVTPEMLEKAWKTTDDSVLPDMRLMMDGCDFTASQIFFPELIAKINEVDAGNNRRWVHTTMPEFIALLKKAIHREKLPVVKGELRDGPVGEVTGNALSTRLYLKRLNKHAQNMLIRSAEPLSLIAEMLGAEYPANLVKKAWHYLIFSHTHDSINGVMQDKAVADICHRLNQVVEISEAVEDYAMQEIVKRIDTRSFAEEDVLLIVFNPLPYERKGIIEAWVNMPDTVVRNRQWPPPQEGLQVFDADGNEVGVQWQARSQQSYCVWELHTRAFPYNCQRHKIYFDPGTVPAGGYKIFRVSPLTASRAPGVAWSTSAAKTGSLLVSPYVMENEYLKVVMNPNGTFNLTDKQHTHTFYNLNSFEDCGEHGDYWLNERPMYDQMISSLGCSALIYAKESGPLRTTLVAEITLPLPSKGIREQNRRGDERIDMRILTELTLGADSQQLEVNIEFDNRHEDHRLRVLFPTGLEKATHVDSGGLFTVDRRPIRPQGPTPESVWPDMATLPQNNFVDINDGTIGLALINDGIMEYEVVDNAERILAMTVLRSVRNWYCTETRVGTTFEMQKGSQCLGRHTIRYALRPHQGDWMKDNIPLHAELFNVPPRVVQTNSHEGVIPSACKPLFSLSNPCLRFSTMKKTEDRNNYLIRLYNPTALVQSGTISLPKPITGAWLTNLNEEQKADIPFKANELNISLKPSQILSIEVAI